MFTYDGLALLAVVLTLVLLQRIGRVILPPAQPELSQ